MRRHSFHGYGLAGMACIAAGSLGLTFLSVNNPVTRPDLYGIPASRGPIVVTVTPGSRAETVTIEVTR
jgi:hypothetical protein